MFVTVTVKYSCDLQAIPLNCLKRINCNSLKISLNKFYFKKSISSTVEP